MKLVIKSGMPFLLKEQTLFWIYIINKCDDFIQWLYVKTTYSFFRLFLQLDKNPKQVKMLIFPDFFFILRHQKIP